jgi:hypothetical protein
MIETYLSQLKGSGHVALNYVIRKIPIPAPGTIFQTDAEQAVAIAPLIGDQYNRDNAKVYGILKQLCLEGPGRSYILDFDRAKNGRGAWLAMFNHFEGDSYHNRAKLEAYATLDTIHYDGGKKGFTFEKFVEKHNECYLELARHNEPVYEEKKVRDFLQRINAPELQAAKQQVRANESMMTNFQLAANFIALSVTPTKQSTRYVAATHTGPAPPAGRGRRSTTPDLPLNSSLYVVPSVRTFLCAPETEPVCHLGKFSKTKNRIFSAKLTIRICFLHV